MSCSTVDKLQTILVHVFDDHGLPLRFRRNCQPVPDGHRSNLVFAVLIKIAGAVRLPREDAELLVHIVGLAEEYPWKQLEIKAHFADPCVGQRLVEVNANDE